MQAERLGSAQLTPALPAGKSCPEVAQKAQALLEQSLLNELRSCVGRALSGMELYPKQDDDGDMMDDDTSMHSSSGVCASCRALVH